MLTGSSSRNGLGTPTTRERLFGLEAERREVETKLEWLGQTPVIALHPGAAELYRRRIEDLEEALTGVENIQHRASAVLRSVIDKIILHPGDARGEIEIELHGALAAILQLGEQKKISGLDAGGMTVMVAGARNHRELAIPPVSV